jgi:hypothetical protein
LHDSGIETAAFLYFGRSRVWFPITSDRFDGTVIEGLPAKGQFCFVSRLTPDIGVSVFVVSEKHFGNALAA